MSRLWAVGIGPGGPGDMTPRAREALQKAEVLCGYTKYMELLGEEERAGKELIETPMTREAERCKAALERAAAGKAVAVVCSGDAGVYGMAGLLYQLGEDYPQVEISVVPGVTAAVSGAALLGAPIGHDFAVISLSDLLTPWELIERRLAACASADMILCLYNPGSKTRTDYLRRACAIMGKHKSPDTVCGVVRSIGREGEEAQVLSLAELAEYPADMFTTVFVGNSMTFRRGDRMITPRGYRQI